MVQPRMLMTLAIAGLIVWWPLTFAEAQTAADVFQVSRISVDATAADAVAAREQALLQGQIEGLHRLLRRLAPTAEHGRLPAVGAAEIQRYVQNFEISDEQVASNRYLAQLTARYAACCRAKGSAMPKRSRSRSSSCRCIRRREARACGRKTTHGGRPGRRI